eukprot:TRINITY_DN17077_c0_g2_i1.p1 TRINITY_DN17077_c0_g2~~TRINITY_DN17077_c0_g2_i1.p1  ORF type:complete len:692 (-),score=192.40 TRINITY_DN17077_c0_g2_i1:54-2129(-)
MGKASTLLLLVLLCSCVLSVVNGEFYTKRSGIVDLNARNFRELVLSGKSGLPWIVEFYAPWCGHCQKLKPEYVQMAAKLKGIVNVGAVDCDDKSNGAIAQQYQIQGFPTIKVITPDGKAHDYNGPRTAGSMAQFVVNFLDSQIYAVSQGSEAKFLNTDPNLAKVILFTDKPKTTPLYKSLSAQFSKYAKFGEVKKVAALSAKYGVDSYPAMFVVPAGQTEPQRYEGEMNPEAIKTFLKGLIPDYKEDTPKSSGGSSSSKREKPEQPPPKSGGATKGDYNVKLTAQNFDSLVLDSDAVWMVEFYAPWCGHCKALAPEWQKAADSMKGTVKFGAVDATVETALASKYKIEGYPTIKVFPALKENKNRRAEDYRGQRTAAAISAFAAQQIPDLVSALPLPQMQQWLANNAAGLPTFILITAKDSTPTLMKSLALEFKGRARFGAILTADMETLNQITNGPSDLTLPVMFAVTQEGARAYRGPLGMGPLSDFVRHFVGSGSSGEAGPSSHGSPAAPEKGIAFLDSQDAFESACLKRLGLCVIAFPPVDNGVWESESSYRAFEETAEKLKARPYHFMWADPAKQNEFADAFRLPDDGSIGLIALHPGKKRFAVFVGVFDPEGISEFIDNVTRGKIPTSGFSSLPTLQSDLSFDQSAENSTSSAEDTFDRDDDEDTGKCSSKPDDDSGTCSLPKDEL